MGNAALPGNLTIREIEPSDAESAAKLSAELGYPVDVPVMEERLRRLRSDAKGTVVYAACLDSTVVGWIEIGLTRHLAAGLRAEISGLVVSSSVRSQGIGGRLVAEAEKWALRNEVPVVIVRSRTVREAAHRFYEREGYSRYKTSAVFQKTLFCETNSVSDEGPIKKDPAKVRPGPLT